MTLLASQIPSYHAHIYFKTPEQRIRAGDVRTQISERFAVKMGSWRDVLVGPHAAPMYQVAFNADVFPTLVPWLMLNRQGLTILLHPNTRNPRADHLVHAIWYGEVLPIMNQEKLPEISDEDPIVIPDAIPKPS